MTRLITADTLCVAAEETLREHLPTVIELLGLHTSDNPRVVAPYVTPKQWDQVPSAEAIETSPLPAGRISSPGLVERPLRVGTWGTGHNATWRVSVGIYDRGRSYDETASRTRTWAALVRATMLAHPTLGGVASSLMWAGEEYRNIARPDAARTFGGCAVAFDVTADNVVDLSVPNPVGSTSTTVSVKSTNTTVSVRPPQE